MMDTQNFKKTFLSYSAVIEALTGIGLIFAPTLVATILLNAELSNTLEKLLAMVAGVAISSIALCAWSGKSMADSSAVIKMLLCYNAFIAVVLLYGMLSLGFGGPVLWAVIIFHLIQSVISIRILMKTRL